MAAVTQIHSNIRVVELQSFFVSVPFKVVILHLSRKMSQMTKKQLLFLIWSSLQCDTRRGLLLA